MKTLIIYCALIKKKCTLPIVVNVAGPSFSSDNVRSNAHMTMSWGS